jgi:aspartate carbamoyltransferase catalytic subunit
VIQDQVEMGVAVRMACMDLLARNLRAERGVALAVLVFLSVFTAIFVAMG